MKKRNSICTLSSALALTILLLVLVPSVSSANDDLTYIYTYQSKDLYPYSGTTNYLDVGYIWVQISTPTPLYASIDKFQDQAMGGSPDMWSFADGISSFVKEASNLDGDHFDVYTLSADGLPTSWFMLITDYDENGSLHWIQSEKPKTPTGPNSVYDYVRISGSDGWQILKNGNSPGEWTLNVVRTNGITATPEPSTYVLLGVGLLLFGAHYASRKYMSLIFATSNDTDEQPTPRGWRLITQKLFDVTPKAG